MNDIYEKDLNTVYNSIPNIEKLKKKKIFIAGSNGLIGSFIIDFIMYLNNKYDYGTTIIANSRSSTKLFSRFEKYKENKYFKYYIGDINENINYDGSVDYIINCASNTHPFQYANDPIGTILTNIRGNANILNFSVAKKVKKIIFLSSVEIYGENINNVERFKEDQMGYINCNSLRAGYNESKRTGEALCQAYIEKYDLDISIVRLPRIYGPTVKKDDTKAMSQFINNALNNEDIVLKSKGEQYFSYLYVADAVSGILTTLINGKKGEAYNLGNIYSDIKLKDLAKLISSEVSRKVIFKIPNATEQKGFSKSVDARLNYDKISNELNWQPKFDISTGINHTINILKEKNNKAK